METHNPTQHNSQDEAYLNGLLVRISSLEKEQKLSRTQIQRLAEDKKRIKQMLHELVKERKDTELRHVQQENLNSSLLVEIQNKTLEEKQLRNKMEELQHQAEQEIQVLRKERDAALLLVEGRNTIDQPSFYQQYNQLIYIAILMFFIIFIISLWLLL